MCAVNTLRYTKPVLNFPSSPRAQEGENALSCFRHALRQNISGISPLLRAVLEGSIHPPILPAPAAGLLRSWQGSPGSCSPLLPLFYWTGQQVVMVQDLVKLLYLGGLTIKDKVPLAWAIAGRLEFLQR